MPVWTPAEMHRNAVTKDPHMQRESEGPVCSRHTASAHIPWVSFSLSHVFSTNFPIVASEHRGLIFPPVSNFD